MHDAEDRGVCANAERESHDDHGRESRHAPEGTRREDLVVGDLQASFTHVVHAWVDRV